MGYRSDVCVALTDDAMRLFRTLVDHLPESHEIHMLLNDAQTGYNPHPWGESHKNPDESCEEKLYWEGIKWYEGYECVDFIQAFMLDCIPEEDYKFIRIGEDSDDVETSGAYWDADIWVQRAISW